MDLAQILSRLNIKGTTSVGGNSTYAGYGVTLNADGVLDASVGGGGGGIPDAPDSDYCVRKSGAWSPAYVELLGIIENNPEAIGAAMGFYKSEAAAWCAWLAAGVSPYANVSDVTSPGLFAGPGTVGVIYSLDIDGNVILPDGCQLLQADPASDWTAVGALPLPSQACKVYDFSPTTTYDVDAVLVALDNYGLYNGYVSLVNCNPPGAPGLAAKSSLEGKAWFVAVAADTPELNGFVLLPSDGSAVTLNVTGGPVPFYRASESTEHPTEYWPDASGGLIGWDYAYTGIPYPADAPWPNGVSGVEIVEGCLFMATDYEGACG